MEDPDRANFLAWFLLRVLEHRDPRSPLSGAVELTAGEAVATLTFGPDGVVVRGGACPGANLRVKGTLAALAGASEGGLPVGAWMRGQIGFSGSWGLGLKFLRLFQGRR